MRHGTVLDWIRRPRNICKGVSNVWSNLLAAWNILVDWLVWSPRDGRLIKVVEGPFIGVSRSHKLLENLKNSLHQQNIFILAQVSMEQENAFTLQKSKSSANFQFQGPLQEEWTHMCEG